MDTPRRPTPAPTAHPNRHTPTKIAYRPTAHPLSTDRLNHSRQNADSPQAITQDPARTRGLSPSRLPAVGSLKLSPFPAPPTSPGVSMPASSEPAAASEVASGNSEAAPAAASTLQVGTDEVLSKSVPNATQQDQLTVRELPIKAVPVPLHTGSPPAANTVPVEPQASQVLVKDASAAQSLLRSDCKAASGTTPAASACCVRTAAAPCARGKRIASEAASGQKGQHTHGLSWADEAAQKHTAGLMQQHVPPRNATAAGSNAVAAPYSNSAELLGSALMPRSDLGAAPLQTCSASHSASVSPTARPDSSTVTAEAHSDMYAVSDALLLDNISAAAAAAAASQGSAGSMQSEGASRQTAAASSSSTTQASKGAQVGSLPAENPTHDEAMQSQIECLSLETWLEVKHTGKKS